MYGKVKQGRLVVLSWYKWVGGGVLWPSARFRPHMSMPGHNSDFSTTMAVISALDVGIGTQSRLCSA